MEVAPPPFEGEPPLASSSPLDDDNGDAQSPPAVAATTMAAAAQVSFSRTWALLDMPAIPSVDLIKTTSFPLPPGVIKPPSYVDFALKASPYSGLAGPEVTINPTRRLVRRDDEGGGGRSPHRVQRRRRGTR